MDFSEQYRINARCIRIPFQTKHINNTIVCLATSVYSQIVTHRNQQHVA